MTATKERVHVTWLGHSAFKLECGDHRLILDPFIQGSPTCPVPLEEVLRWNLDGVVVSHAHGDHWGNALEIAKAGAELVTNFEIGEYAQAHGASKVVSGGSGGTVPTCWGKVTFTPAVHSSSFPDGTYGGNPQGLVLHLGGQKLYFAGDTCLFSDMHLIGDLGLDMAFLPIGDHYTMGPKEAARCLELLRPRVAIPMHYGTFPPLIGDPQEFLREGEAWGVDIRILGIGESTTLEPGIR